LTACLNGDSDAWEILLVRYQRLIYSIPIKIGFSPNDAADVFQSVCLRFLEGLPKLRNLERVGAWLTTTTKRECWRVAARKQREHIEIPVAWEDTADQDLGLASSAPLADEISEILEQQQILRDAVDALPERCRNLITMLFYSDESLSYADTARQLNMQLNSMGATRARCLAKLRELLENKL
jgi:RNA polymerase sigma factor (sigma-70 family)